MRKREDADDDSPFGGVTEVDGIVYSEQTESPELNIRPDTFASTPELPERPAPVRRQQRPAQPWQPGPTVNPTAFRPKVSRPNPLKVFLAGSIPIVLILSMILVVKWLYQM